MKIEQKHNLISNIDFLLKRKGVKKAELESNAGFSAGYLSRFKSGGADNLPSVSFLSSAADQLDTDIDTLLNCDLSKQDHFDKYMIDLLNKLIKDTRQCKIRWFSGHSDKSLPEDSCINENSVFYPKKVSVTWLGPRESFDEDGIREPGEEEFEEELDCLGFEPAEGYYDSSWEIGLSEPFVQGCYSGVRINDGAWIMYLPIAQYPHVNPATYDPIIDRTLWIVTEENSDRLITEEYASPNIKRLLDDLEIAIENAFTFISDRHKDILDRYISNESGRK